MHGLAKVITSFNSHILEKQMTLKSNDLKNKSLSKIRSFEVEGSILGGLGHSSVTLKYMGVLIQFKDIFKGVNQRPHLELID